MIGRAVHRSIQDAIHQPKILHPSDQVEYPRVRGPASGVTGDCHVLETDVIGAIKQHDIVVTGTAGDIVQVHIPRIARLGLECDGVCGAGARRSKQCHLLIIGAAEEVECDAGRNAFDQEVRDSSRKRGVCSPRADRIGAGEWSGRRRIRRELIGPDIRIGGIPRLTVDVIGDGRRKRRPLGVDPRTCSMQIRVGGEVRIG